MDNESCERQHNQTEYKHELNGLKNKLARSNLRNKLVLNKLNNKPALITLVISSIKKFFNIKKHYLKISMVLEITAVAVYSVLVNFHA